MPRFRNFRWPLGFLPTTLLSIPFMMLGLWYGIHGYFWLVQAGGDWVLRRMGCPT